jgi:hypothetical protein
MKLETWLRNATADAEQRRLPELKPLLEGLAQATQALRGADFSERADDDRPSRQHPANDHR